MVDVLTEQVPPSLSPLPPSFLVVIKFVQLPTVIIFFGRNSVGVHATVANNWKNYQQITGVLCM